MLRFEGIHFTYPGAAQPALAGVDLEIPQGRALGLLGPNGAGKTTLIALAAGLLRPQGGRITTDGRLALVPQDNAFYPVLTVRENLAFFGQVQGLHGAALREREAAVLAFAQLEPFAKRRAGQLSGGLKRRLNLAIGLLAEPEVLLLDEPTVGVDPQSRHFLLEAIGGLVAQGRTILYTSHYMDEIEALCGHVAILDQGRLLTAGTLGEVLASAPPVLQVRLTGEPPAALLAAWTARYGVEPLPDHRYNLQGFTGEEIPAFLAEARAAGATLDAWSWGQQHLDQVFMRLTKRALRDE
jgi:ABC-2 type transport system ATP-binding protein